jgi:hypothetical protein
MWVLSVYIAVIFGFGTARVLARLGSARDPAGDKHYSYHKIPRLTRIGGL